MNFNIQILDLSLLDNVCYSLICKTLALKEGVLYFYHHHGNIKNFYFFIACVWPKMTIYGLYNVLPWIWSHWFPCRSGKTLNRSVMRTTRRSCAVWYTATWPPHGKRCRAWIRPRWRTWTTYAKICRSFATRWGTCWASGHPNTPCSTQGAKAKKTVSDLFLPSW